MLIALFTWNVLRESRPTDQSHLVRIETAEIHRLANVAVGFGPWLANLENLDSGKFKSAAVQDCRDTLQKLTALFERHATPGFKSIVRGF